MKYMRELCNKNNKIVPEKSSRIVLCLCADSGVQRILCSVFVFCCCFFRCLLYPMLPVLCLCADSGIQHILCSVFVFCCCVFLFVFCTLRCRLCVCVQIVVSNTYCVLFLFFVVVFFSLSSVAYVAGCVFVCG